MKGKSRTRATGQVPSARSRSLFLKGDLLSILETDSTLRADVCNRFDHPERSFRRMVITQGLSSVREVAMSAIADRYIYSLSPHRKRLQQLKAHSLRTARLMRFHASTYDLDPAFAFGVGLLHDAGSVFAIQEAETVSVDVEWLKNRPMLAELSKRFLKRWRLTGELAHAILAHHRADPSTPLTALLSCCDALAMTRPHPGLTNTLPLPLLSARVESAFETLGLGVRNRKTFSASLTTILAEETPKRVSRAKPVLPDSSVELSPPSVELLPPPDFLPPPPDFLPPSVELPPPPDLPPPPSVELSPPPDLPPFEPPEPVIEPRPKTQRAPVEAEPTPAIFSRMRSRRVRDAAESPTPQRRPSPSVKTPAKTESTSAIFSRMKSRRGRDTVVEPPSGPIRRPKPVQKPPVRPAQPTQSTKKPVWPMGTPVPKDAPQTSKTQPKKTPSKSGSGIIRLPSDSSETPRRPK